MRRLGIDGASVNRVHRHDPKMAVLREMATLCGMVILVGSKDVDAPGIAGFDGFA
jgi:hypothetical protein